ncbi:MAG: GNAT family N-acetyltransferase [Defluviitaleaceae bacterium]|nr:GNAT family N-acetyltransferase [Defluviitaleaceae bacterium]
MINEIKKQLKDYDIVNITEQNFAQVFEIYETNQDFFLLTQGKKASIESSVNDIVAVPPNFDFQQKIYISLWKEGKIIGVLDLLQGYPTQTCIWIGLLLIHGHLQGGAIGSKIVNALLDVFKNAGYKRVQLGVIENNTKGISFWQKHGFSKIRMTENIVVMERTIK